MYFVLFLVYLKNGKLHNNNNIPPYWNNVETHSAFSRGDRKRTEPLCYLRFSSCTCVAENPGTYFFEQPVRPCAYALAHAPIVVPGYSYPVQIFPMGPPDDRMSSPYDPTWKYIFPRYPDGQSLFR